MLKPLGENLTSQDFIKIALGKQHAFVILQNGDIQRPLVVPYPVLLQAIASSINLPAGSAAWGSILPGTGVGSQADLIEYLDDNYYPLNDNPASYVTASQLTTALLSYVTTSALATDLLGYVPTSRELTINGVTYDLSADRSWTISGGGSVNSVNSGINISVTGTATDPIINSLSDRYKTTSTTSNSVSNGSKSFTVDLNLSYIPLQEILVVFDASNHMHGTVTSYNAATGALVVDIKNHTGSGTYNAWVLNLDGTPVDALTGSGTTGQIAIFTAPRVLGSVSIASISTVSSIFQEDVYITNTAPIGTEYVPSVGKLYVCNNTSGNVTIFDTVNGSLLATISVTNAFRVKYIQSINEVWITSTSLTTITRIDPSTNLLLGTFSVGVAGGSDFFEYSSTKVFLVISAGSGSIRVIDPTSFTVTATITTNVPSFPGTMAYNSNSASLQFNKIVITAAAGVFILDPVTNLVSTTLANPSSAFSSGGRILYSITDDKYYAASQVNNRLVVLSIATATTFTATFLGNSLFVNDIRIDEANDLLFAFPVEGGAGQNVLVKIYKKSTMAPIIAFRTSCYGGTSQAGNAAIDLLNKRIFLTGRNTAANSSVSVIRYL